MLDLFIVLLYLVFSLSAIVLVVVILLQEGKGGGLGQALGGHAQTTFGVAASGINRFTGITAAVFLGSALLIHICQGRQTMGVDIEGLGVEQPAGDLGLGEGGDQ